MKRAATGAGFAAAGVSGLAWPTRAGGATSANGILPESAAKAGARFASAAGAPAALQFGVASYSLREFSREEAIQMMTDLGVTNVSVKSFHLPYELSEAELQRAVDEFRQAGLELVSSGNNTISEDTDEHVGAFFDYAKAAGIPMLVIAPDPEVLPRIESFVKRYDIQVAIHNHGPEDSWYPAPSDAIALIKDMDPRVGVCVDVGHTARTGKDVVQEISDAGARVLDIHMKDLLDLNDRDSQVAVGEGKLPIAEIFRQLVEIGYTGSINLEYEIYPNDPFPGMRSSLAYMRGVREGLAG